MEWKEQYNIYTLSLGVFGYIQISWENNNWVIDINRQRLQKTFRDLELAKPYAVQTAKSWMIKRISQLTD